MNKKNLIILGVIFAILIGLVFIKKSVKPKIPTTEEIANIVSPSVQIDNISEMTLRLGDGIEEDKSKPQNVCLVKEDGQWVVKTQYGVRANEKAIASALDKLDQMQGELRSDNEGLLADYGISGDQALHILLNHQDGVIHLVVGLERAGYQNNFVRFGEKNAVYVVNKNLLGTFGVREEEEGKKLDINKWIDKRITHIEAGDVVGIAVTEAVNGSEQTVMDIRKKTVGDKKKWDSVMPYAFGLSAAKIKSMVERFNSTYAREVVAPDVEGVFDAPGWSGLFTMESGDQLKLVRGAKDEEGKNYYVKQEGAGYFYLVPVSTFDNREKQQGDIFASNPLKVEEGDVDGIEIYDMDREKKFSVSKKTTPEAVDVSAEGEDSAGKKAEGLITWQTPKGKTISETKVKNVIGKLKDVNPEIVSQSFSSLKGALSVSITMNGETKKYTISKDEKLTNDKECHFLTVNGEDQDYCVSKAQVKAIQDALP